MEKKKKSKKARLLATTKELAIQAKDLLTQISELPKEDQKWVTTKLDEWDKELGFQDQMRALSDKMVDDE